MKSHAWEQRVLGDFLEVSMETNSSAKFDKNDVLSISGDYGVVNQIAFQGRSFASNSVVKYGVLHNEDIVYTKSPLKANPYGIIKTNKGKAGIVSPLYAIYHPKNNLVPSFVQSYFEQNERLNNYLRPLVNKGAKNNMLISNEKAISGKVIFPSRKEQEKISALLERVDSLLTLHQRKWVEFFYPTYFRKFSFLNFWEFFNNRITNAWEQRKIKDLAANTYGGGTPSTSNPDFWEGSIPWIQSSDLSEHNLFRVRPRKFISQAAVTNSPVKIIPESSIAVITRVGVGKLAVMNFSYTTSQDFLSLSNLNTDVKFTSYQLYRRLQKDLNAVQGTSIKGITKEELLGKNIFIPGRQEQEAIGKFFSKIDSLLTLHQRQSVSSDLLGASLHL